MTIPSGQDPADGRIHDISAVLIVGDGVRGLRRCLDSLRAFDDVVVLDNGGNGEAAAIIAECPWVRRIAGEFEGFGPTRNRAAEAARHDWILTIDADEWATPRLIETLRGGAPADPRFIHTLLRRSIFLGRPLRSGLGRERLKRLYHRRHYRFEGRVHEWFVAIEGGRPRCRRLVGEVWHDSYTDIGELFHKRWLYAQPELRDHLRLRHPALALLRAWWRFLRCYLLKAGFIDGWRGLVLAYAEGYGTFLKYVWRYGSPPGGRVTGE